MLRKLLESPFARAAAVIFLVGLLTLLPRGASHPNHLGYYSLCSFAPWSTLILTVLAVMVYRLDTAVSAVDRGRMRRGY